MKGHGRVEHGLYVKHFHLVLVLYPAQFPSGALAEVRAPVL